MTEQELRLTALEKASLIPNQSTAELLQSADKIYNWLIQGTKKPDQ